MIYKASDRYELEKIRDTFKRESRHVQAAIDKGGYTCENVRVSVSGNWTGIQAVIGEISHPEDDSETMVIYILVDGYENARWKDADDLPSKWQTVKLLCESMRLGIPVKQLYDAIVEVIVKKVGPVAPSDMIRLHSRADH